MAITNGYTTVATFQSYTGMTTITADETVNIEKAIESASRSIDRMTNRRFWADTNATARQYRATDFYRLFVDDISSTTGLAVALDTGGDGTFETSLVFNTDYILDPVNAPQLERPFTVVTMVGTTLFPSPVNLRPGVQVTAKFGWYNGTPPDDIEEACLILSTDLVKRASSVGGVLGLSELGAIRMSPLGRDVQAMVRPYRREVLA
ncbi:MAG: hypothetical protein ACO3S3_12075 [Pseudohongiellaceae bacterium]|jgi:hypothetical protein